MNDKIDIVVLWVDGNDPQWLKQKTEWFNRLNPDKGSNSVVRYQSWDNLKYWFRAIENNLSWFNMIFFVTWGHIPDFLKVNHPKLRIVRHDEYIPQDYLPTFNANTIELNLHRIKSLSENFVYFNDDTFPLVPINENYYFQNNLICDEAIETPIIPVFSSEISKFTWNMRALDISVINRHFSKREVQKQHSDKWFNPCYGNLIERNNTLAYWDNFVGLRDPHVPTSFKKSSFDKVWKAESEILENTCITKFRNFNCVNQWLVRYWQICEGNFVPRRTLGKSFSVNEQNCYEISEIITKKQQQMVCLNEDCSGIEFEKVKMVINSAFDKLYPYKSTFEK